MTFVSHVVSIYNWLPLRVILANVRSLAGVGQGDGLECLVGEQDVGDGNVLAAFDREGKEVAGVAECLSFGGPHDDLVLVAMCVAVVLDALEIHLVGWVGIERHTFE